MRMPQSTVCKACGSFRQASGARLICHPCNRARVLTNQKAHPDRVNARNRPWKKEEIQSGWTRAQRNKLRDRYGMTIKEYEALKASQGARCAICNEMPSILAVDHNHGKGNTRALLCKGCNFGLGNFKDNPTHLRAAAAYLEAHECSR